MDPVDLQVGNKCVIIPLDLARIRGVHLNIIQGIRLTDQGGVRQPFWRCLLLDWLCVRFLVCFCWWVLLSREALALPGLLVFMLQFVQRVLADLIDVLVVGGGAYVC